MKPSHARIRCQSILSNKERCSRDAVFKLDLKKQRKILGIEIPTVDCCRYCSQHAKQLVTGFSVYGLIQLTPILVRTTLTPEQQQIWDMTKYI